MKRVLFWIGLLLAPPAVAQIAPVTVQVSPAEAHSIQVSGDGGHVFYAHSFSEAGALLTGLYHFERSTGLVQELLRSPIPPVDHESYLLFGGCSSDGRYVAFTTGLEWTGSGSGGPVYSNQTQLLDRWTGQTETISSNLTGGNANRSSVPVDVNADGRYVLFTSFANDLVPGDSLLSLDLFRRDRLLGQTIRISETVDGTPISDNDIHSASISGDGSLVVFSSDAYNLSLPTPSKRQVFLRSVPLGITVVVSETDAGLDANGSCSGEQLSRDGRFVSFSSWATNLDPTYPGGDANGVADVFVKDLETGSLERISFSSFDLESNDTSAARGVSEGGRYALFESYATNLVPGDGNQNADVFVRDRWAHVTRRVSVASDGTDTYPAVGGSLSADGRFVAYQKATAPDLGGFPCCSPAFLHDTKAGGAWLQLQGLSAGSTANLVVLGASPSGSLLVGWSLTPQAATPSPWGLLDVGVPFAYLWLVADAAGELHLPIGIPAALLGLELWVQGVDLTSGYPTSAFGARIP